MTILTEGARTAQFIVSEANNFRSRDAVTITVPANTTFAAGTVLGQQTSGLKFVRHDADGTDDGRRTASAVLYAELANSTGSAVDYTGTVLARDCEVHGDKLTYEDGADAAAKTAANASLASAGIIVR